MNSIKHEILYIDNYLLYIINEYYSRHNIDKSIDNIQDEIVDTIEYNILGSVLDQFEDFCK